MIPKIIHYCWFGRNPLPDSAKKCIESWRKFFPEYEIKEWNEDNFDVHLIPYVEEAYNAKKYAFVSDYARFWILYFYGGVYFDTDVEVIRPMDDILAKGGFMGVQHDYFLNPGLGMASVAYHQVYKFILDYYQNLHFLKRDGSFGETTIVIHTTNVLMSLGYKKDGRIIQNVEGIYTYPSDYFNPFDDLTGVMRKTKNTRTIHWFSKTWCSNYGPIRTSVTRLAHRMFGVNSLKWLKNLVN